MNKKYSRDAKEYTVNPDLRYLLINYSDNLYVYFIESDILLSMDVKKSESGASEEDS